MHRNNAAEWVMFAVLWPIAMIVRGIDRVRRKS
jgi:hypothetical protein